MYRTCQEHWAKQDGTDVAVFMIVEDDAFVCEHIVMLVEGWGHTALSAVDVADAMLRLEASVQVDILITDVRLKTETHGGFDLARRARLTRPALLVLYASGSAATADMAKLFVPGAQHIRKPFTEQALHGAVQRLMGTLQ